ncbi:DUF6220 domain-containing protein [Actinopolymorpha alba]|uniref:DUF6220 domain-containing protein n=1 Tax=Actinopolymorpha alba TaxID=533267 RepID=UPI00036D4DB8|nr:DUF6220 domain-containing protein [Actinopolymorpha alba]
MRKVFAVMARLLMLAIVVQFYFAAMGAFDSAPNDEAFQPHRGLGYGIVLIAVLTTLVAALARMPGRLIGTTGLVAGLGVVQGVIALIAKAFNDAGDTSTTAGKLVFGLHAVNGLIIMGVVGRIIRQTRELSGPAAPTRGAGTGEDARAAGSAAGSAQPAS